MSLHQNFSAGITFRSKFPDQSHLVMLSYILWTGLGSQQKLDFGMRVEGEIWQSFTPQHD